MTEPQGKIKAIESRRKQNQMLFLKWFGIYAVAVIISVVVSYEVTAIGGIFVFVGFFGAIGVIAYANRHRRVITVEEEMLFRISKALDAFRLAKMASEGGQIEVGDKELQKAANIRYTVFRFGDPPESSIVQEAQSALRSIERALSEGYPSLAKSGDEGLNKTIEDLEKLSSMLVSPSVEKAKGLSLPTVPDAPKTPSKTRQNMTGSGAGRLTIASLIALFVLPVGLYVLAILFDLAPVDLFKDNLVGIVVGYLLVLLAIQAALGHGSSQAPK